VIIPFDLENADARPARHVSARGHVVIPTVIPSLALGAL
jgi:hypothetical protein